MADETLIIHTITLTYGIGPDGEPDLGITTDGDHANLITTLGMLRLAEDTVIREAMGEIDDEDRE